MDIKPEKEREQRGGSVKFKKIYMKRVWTKWIK